MRRWSSHARPLAILPLLLLAVLPSVGAAETCSDFENLIHWVGALPAVTETAGVATGGDLFVMFDGAAGGRIFRMVPQNGPQLEATIPALTSVRRAVFVGTMLYAADGGRIVAYDLANPAAPAPLDTLDFGAGEVRELAACTNGVAAARGPAGVSIVDCRDPAHLVVTRTVPIPGAGALDVAAQGGLLAVAEGDTLFTLDIDPLKVPVTLHRLALTGKASLVSWSGNWAATSGALAHVMIVDLTDPAAPAVAAELNYGSPTALLAAPDRLYTAGFELTVTDMTDPAVPLPLGTSMLPGDQLPPGNRGGQELALLGNTLLVADGAAGGCGFEPAGAAAARPLAATGGVSMSKDFAFCGSLATVTSMGVGARLFDLANPASPQTRGLIAKANCVVAARQPYVYLVTDEGALSIHDVTNPDAPIQVGSCALRPGVTDCLLVGGWLYVLTVEGLIPVDVHDPAAPVSQGTMGGMGSGRLAVAGETLFLARDTALEAFSIHDQAAPAFLGSLTCPERLQGLAAFGGRVYLAAGATGVIVVNVVDPAHPSLVETVPVPTAAVDIAARGGWLYIVDSTAGLLVSDARWTGNGLGIRGQVMGTSQAARVRAGDGMIGVLVYDQVQLVAPSCFVITPTFLAAFTATPGPSLTTLNWQTGGAADGDFRVTARLGARNWEVPSRALGDGEYGATDASPALAAGGTVVYTLWFRAPDQPWQVLAVREATLPAARTALLAPRPNPFNPRTTLAFTLARDGRARVTIHDAAGRRLAILADGIFPAGRTELVWDGRDAGGHAVASGVYFARLRADDGLSLQRLTLVR